MHILLIQSEYRKWKLAKKWAYHSHIGIAEALENNGIQCTILTTTWLSKAKEICQEKSFDQVWICDPSHAFDANGNEIPEYIMEWVSTLSPIVLGIVVETIYYSLEEYEAHPWLEARRRFVKEGYLKYFTHLAVIDELDAKKLNNQFSIPTMWNPCSVPEKLICEQPVKATENKAFFSGDIYKLRKQWIDNASLLGHQLFYKIPKNNDYNLSKIFDKLPGHRFSFLMKWIFDSKTYAKYLKKIKKIRRSGFLMWQRDVLQYGLLVVNLPHFVKGYPGRVVEGIAAGRLVVSWKIPNRPLNAMLFEENKEIFLFSDANRLKEQIDTLLTGPTDLIIETVQNAQQKLRKFHTSEKRVQQIIHWINTGIPPNFK